MHYFSRKAPQPLPYATGFSPYNRMPAWLLTFALALAVAAPAWAKPQVVVEVEGVSGKEQENVLGFLSLEQQKDYPLLTEGLIDYLYGKAPEEIRQALRPFGYYKPEVQSNLTRTDDKWIAHFDIKPGPPLKVTDMNLHVSGAGADDPEFEKLLKNLPLNAGDIMDTRQYDATKQALQQLAMERGYLDAEFTRNAVRVDIQAYTANVILQFATGKRYHFGKVTFYQDILNNAFLDTFIPFKEGDPYNVNDLLRLQKALSDSGYYSRVEVRPRRDLASDSLVPIQVVLAPRKPNHYTAGIGYGTDTGIRGSVGWERRRVNRNGHRLSVAASVSQVSNEETVNYVIPLRFLTGDQLVISGSRINENVDTGSNTTNRLSVTRSRAWGDWHQTYGLNYQYEPFTIAGVTRHSSLLMPAISWLRVRAGDRVYVTHGSLLKIDLRGAYNGLLSNTSFLQTEIDSKVIRQPLKKGRILLRAHVGATTVSDFDLLPRSLRFYAGGDNSIRGYGYQELGPTNAAGDVIGGRNVAVGSVEYNYPIVGKWSAAVFFDAGNAFNGFTLDIRRGTGIGVRWRSPVGLVRVDVAHGLDHPSRTIRLHAVLGPDL